MPSIERKGNFLTRRDFLRLSGSAAAALALAACNVGEVQAPTVTPKPADVINTKPAPTLEAPKPTATRPPELTPTSNENYPKKLADLKVVADTPIAEFAKKYPDQGLQKELGVLKAKWVEGLKAIGVSEQDVVFGVNEYSWDSGKGYSWIMCVTGKNGEVYVPRDSASHTRMIDFSAYTSAMKSVPFTVEKLPLPEFHNFEYEVLHGRSDNGWLGMMLVKKGDTTPLAWYDMREEKGARWKDEKNDSLLLKTGVNIENRSQEGKEYTSGEIVKLDILKSALLVAAKENKILQIKGIEQYNRSGECEPVKDKALNLTLGMRKCFRSDNTFEMIPMAWDTVTNMYYVPTEDGVFVKPARTFETGQKLAFDEISYLDDDIKSLGLILNKPSTYRVEFPNEKLVHFAYRRQSEIVSTEKYKRMMLVKMLSPRPASVERISWAEIPIIDATSDNVTEWVSHLFDKDTDNKYINITVKDTSGKYANLSSTNATYKIDEASLRGAFNMVIDLPAYLRKCTIFNPLKLFISTAGITAFNWRQGISEIQLPPSALSTNDIISKKYLTVTATHEFGAHALQFPDTSDKRVDCEFQGYVHSLLASKFLDFQDFSRINFWRQLLQFGSYLRA